MFDLAHKLTREVARFFAEKSALVAGPERGENVT